MTRAEDLGEPHQLVVIGAVVGGRRRGAFARHDGGEVVARGPRLCPRLRRRFLLVEKPEKLGFRRRYVDHGGRGRAEEGGKEPYGEPSVPSHGGGVRLSFGGIRP